MLRLRESSTPTSPSHLVEGLEPSVERVILRCLEPDPARRPPSALAVAARCRAGILSRRRLPPASCRLPRWWPKRDPKGPSVPRWLGRFWPPFSWASSQAGKTQLVRMVPLEKSPDVLVEKARNIVTRAGYPDPPRDETFA